MQKGPVENKRFYPKPHDVALIYVGEGRKVEGLPARDLNSREVMYYGGRFYLLRTGIYAEPEMIKND